MGYEFFNEKSFGSGFKNKIISNKSIIRKLEKGNVNSSFKDNIWGADLADMQLIRKFKKGMQFSLCVNY